LDARRILKKERADLIGVAVAGPLRAGDGLVWSDIADGASHRHLASVVMPGRRAYGLSAKANPLGRLLRVGDHVDVLLEHSGSSETILERSLVLAVGSELSDGAKSERSSGRGRGVTLSVSAKQAELLLAAEERGRLRLTVRNPEDLRLRDKKEAKVEKENHRRLAVVPDEKKEIEHVR
jgi:pilus assembly protein CpaB